MARIVSKNLCIFLLLGYSSFKTRVNVVCTEQCRRQSWDLQEAQQLLVLQEDKMQ